MSAANSGTFFHPIQTDNKSLSHPDPWVVVSEGKYTHPSMGGCGIEGDCTLEQGPKDGFLILKYYILLDMMSF